MHKDKVQAVEIFVGKKSFAHKRLNLALREDNRRCFGQF